MTTSGGGGGRLLVQPLRGVDLVSLDGPGVGPDAGELDVLAQVVPPLPAEEALLAGLLGLHSHSVACDARAGAVSIPVPFSCSGLREGATGPSFLGKGGTGTG